MNTARTAWYRAPMLWLGTAIMLVSISGCIGLILSALRYPDESVAQTRETTFKIPSSRTPQSAGDEN